MNLNMERGQGKCGTKAKVAKGSVMLPGCDVTALDEAEFGFPKFGISWGYRTH
jgi:hypothetical protein